MKKVLPNIFCFTVVSYLLLATSPGYAGSSAKKNPTSFLKVTQQPYSFFFLKKINHSPGVLTITVPMDLQLNTDPGSNAATNVLLGTPLVLADNGNSYVITNNAPASYPIGVTNILWTVTDDKGNTAVATQAVTVTDNEKPYIFRMFEISVVNDPGQCGAVVNLMIPQTYDNSGGPVTITSDAPAYFQVGSLLITWTATDMYGNSDTSTQMITVIDNEVPTISTTNIQVNNTPGKCGAVVNLGTPVTADNCGVVSVTNDAPAFFSVGTTLVHWVVTDKTGYTNETIQTVVVKDSEKPLITPPTALTVNNTAGKCGAMLTLTAPIASDNCGIASITSNAPAQFPTGTTVVTWTASDNSGNTSTVTQNILVKDVEAPVITVPSNIIVNNTLNTCGAIVNFTVTASDNCNSPVTLTYSKSSGSLFATGTTAVTVTAKDVSGNTSIKTFTVTVKDTQKPSVTAPSNVTVTANNNNTATNVNLGTPAANDNCGVKSVTNNAPSIYPSGTTTVTWTVVDVNNNISTATQTVTVNKKKSNAVAPASITLTAEKTAEESLLKVMVAPNPSQTYFTLKMESKFDTPVTLRVTDAGGRVMDIRAGLAANGTVQVGLNYIPGIYFAEMIQGKQRKLIQLLKVK